MKRIILLSNAYKPQYGGLVSYLENFSYYINSHYPDFLVEIVVFTNDSKSPLLEVIDGVKVHRVIIPKVNVLNALIYNKQIIGIGKQYIEKNFTDKDLFVVRHLHFASVLLKTFERNSIYIAPVLIKKMMKYNYDKKMSLKNVFNFISVKQLEKVEKDVFMNLPLVGVLSHSKQLEVKETYGIIPSLVEPAVNTEKFSPSQFSSKKQNLMNLGRKEDVSKKIILTVSRLTREKNTMMLIEALPLLDDDYILYIVGDGELRQELISLVKKLNIENRVVFFGKQEKVEEYYKVADIFALLSTYEGLGHVYLEALSSGIPIISLKADPPRIINASSELIIENENGWIINSKSNLISVLNNLSELQLDSMKVNSRRIALENYSWKNHIDNCLKLISTKAECNEK